MRRFFTKSTKGAEAPFSLAALSPRSYDCVAAAVSVTGWRRRHQAPGYGAMAVLGAGKLGTVLR